MCFYEDESIPYLFLNRNIKVHIWYKILVWLGFSMQDDSTSLVVFWSYFSKSLKIEQWRSINALFGWLSASLFGFAGMRSSSKEVKRELMMSWVCPRFWHGIGLSQNTLVNLHLVGRNGAPPLWPTFLELFLSLFVVFLLFCSVAWFVLFWCQLDYWTICYKRTEYPYT